MALVKRSNLKNVYFELGSTWNGLSSARPEQAMHFFGQLLNMGMDDNIIWGTDSIWTGAPQWQIEALRRLEIPEDMQRKHGFAPLGPADGPVKAAILGGNGARHYGITERRTELDRDGVGRMKAAYLGAGQDRSLAAYGYVVPRG
jgi:predicted TIM-barrel fold metal-dependent hydrolase